MAAETPVAGEPPGIAVGRSSPPLPWPATALRRTAAPGLLGVCSGELWSTYHRNRGSPMSGFVLAEPSTGPYNPDSTFPPPAAFEGGWHAGPGPVPDGRVSVRTRRAGRDGRQLAAAD